MYNKEIFDALIKESQFTCEMLCAGITQIRKANYAKRGVYFQSFISLSTGLERIGKLCLILDYNIKHNGDYPDNKYMKNQIGHDIELIYKKILIIKQSYNFNFDFLQDLENDIHKQILNILSRFAKGERYSNIDLILNKRSYIDPIKLWYEKIDIYFFNNLVSKRRKKSILINSKISEQLFAPYSIIRHTSEDENDIRSIEEASYRTGIFEAVGPFRQLYIFHIIRFFVEMLDSLQYKIMKEFGFEIPYFSEIFRIFFNNDKYIKSRKTWRMV